MADWSAWAQRTGCAVLLIAHPPKSEADYSGSTDWHAASRAVWKLEQPERDNGSNATKLECIKSSYGPLPTPYALTNWRWWKATPWEGPIEEQTSGRGSRKRPLGKPGLA